MTNTHTPAEVFSPGDYLRDELVERGWTEAEFAEITELPLEAVSEVLIGKREISHETALAFSQSLGTTPELWLNLQERFKQDQDLGR